MLVILVAWVNDVMILGPSAMVEQVQKDLEEDFTCKWEGELMDKSVEVNPYLRKYRPRSSQIHATCTST